MVERAGLLGPLSDFQQHSEVPSGPPASTIAVVDRGQVEDIEMTEDTDVELTDLYDAMEADGTTGAATNPMLAQTATTNSTRVAAAEEERKELEQSAIFAEQKNETAVANVTLSPPLPAGWTWAQDPSSGHYYYTHTETGASQWKHPGVP